MDKVSLFIEYPEFDSYSKEYILRELKLLLPLHNTGPTRELATKLYFAKNAAERKKIFRTWLYT